MVLAISLDGLRLRCRRVMGAFPLVTLKRAMLFLMLVAFNAPAFASITVAQCLAASCTSIACASGAGSTCVTGCFMGSPYFSYCGSPITDYVPPAGTPVGGPYPNLTAAPANPHGAGPTVNPIENAVVSAVAGFAFALLGTIALLVGAPILATASAGAVITVGVMTAFGYALGGAPATSQAAVDSAPLSMTLAPASVSPPAPVVGATSTPSIAVDPVSKQFVPGGGQLSSGGASGGWARGGASGEWSYTPPATVANPAPTPTAQISDSGYTVSQTGGASGGSGGGGAPKALIVQRYTDDSVVITQAADVPVTTSGGNPTTVAATVSTAYSGSGAKLTGSPAVTVSDTLGNGASSNGGDGLYLVDTGTGSGTGTGTGSGTVTGPVGGCASGDCSTESTQLANKLLLQDIKGALTGGEAPADPTAKTGSEIGAAISGAYDGPLAGLRGWQLPAHVSQCPSGSFTIPGSSHVFSMDGHCSFASQNLPLLSSIFIVLWNIAALMIVIRL